MSKKLVLTALSLTLLASAPAHAQSDKITIMVGGMEKIIYLPAKLVLPAFPCNGEIWVSVSVPKPENMTSRKVFHHQNSVNSPLE